MTNDDWSDYESGPFCQHRGDPCDCDETCLTCGHTCPEHGAVENEECRVEGCGCQAFVSREGA